MESWSNAQLQNVAQIGDVMSGLLGRKANGLSTQAKQILRRRSEGAAAATAARR